MSNKTDFKVGDKVVCVDNIGEESCLPLHKEYPVDEVYKNSIGLLGVKGLWSSHRFKLSEHIESKAYEKQSEGFEQINEGIKESSDKLMYELDFDFLTQMAERMAVNKNKYPVYNWKKSMD